MESFSEANAGQTKSPLEVELKPEKPMTAYQQEEVRIPHLRLSRSTGHVDLSILEPFLQFINILFRLKIATDTNRKCLQN